MRRLAVGLRSGEGGAACVAIALEGQRVEFVTRRGVTLVDATVEAQPFHAATETPERADEIIDSAVAVAEERARVLLAKILAAAPDVAGIGVVLGNGPAPSRARALRSHVAAHAAEGALYRAALLDAAVATGRPVLGIPERDVAPALETRWPTEGAAQVNGLRTIAGKPWRKPEKLAASVAVLAALDQV